MMIRTALSVLLLAAVVSPAAAQLSVTPQLKREVTVSGDIVRIGDLIENAGPAAATPIFRAPDLGGVGALPAQRVLDAVLPHGLVVVDARGIAEVSVTRASRVIGADDIEGRIARALAGRNTLGDARNLKMVFDREVRPIALEPAVTADLSIARITYDTYSRRFDVAFELTDTGNQRRIFRYTGVAMETVEIATVSRALARGDVVKASDVTIERRPKAELTGEPVALTSDVVGLAARRPVRLGAALRTADLMKPELVQRGDTVTLQYVIPGIVVTLRGKALDSGAEGDTVNVQNVESKRTMQGIVTGPGRVTVNSAPSRIAKAEETKR
jgi:flagella basal body P-ring formation protein FlgA